MIPVLIRGAAMAAKGLKGAGRGVKKASDWGREGARNHPVVQNVANHPITQSMANHPITQRIARNPAAGAIGGAAGLMGGLALAGGRGVKTTGQAMAGAAGKTQGAWVLILPLLLVVVDILLKQNGIPLDILWNEPNLLVESGERILVNGPFWVFVIIFWVLRKPQSKEEYLFPAALILLGLFTINLGGGNSWIFFHMLFALITFFFLIKGFNSSVPISQTHWVFLIVFFIDIFGLATLKALNTGIIDGIIPDLLLNRLVFPIWFFYYLSHIKDSGVKTGITVSIVLFYIIYAGFGYVGTLGPLDIQGLEEELEVAGEVPTTFFGNLADAVKSWFTGQIQYAITGKVEENQYEPLGVYLENVQSADPRYYEDEDAIVWGSIKARTLDDPMYIKVGCYVEKDKKKFYAEEGFGKTDPSERFSVFSFEELDFACTFNKCCAKGPCTDEQRDECKLKKGSNRITTSADFNFETLSQLKAYFISKERQRAMVREGQDIFTEFGIKERRPVAIYTNGPAEIGMRTSSPLISVSKEYTIYPSLDFSLKNRIGWEGKITNLKELVLFLPEGIELESCNMDFKPYKKGDCTDSCKTFVFDECKKFEDSAVCKDEENDCNDACNSLFDEQGQFYIGWALDLEDIKVGELEDFEKAKAFRCRFEPDPEKVLGNAPITTKHFRVKARYDYVVEKRVTVNVKEVPKDVKDIPEGQEDVEGPPRLEEESSTETEIIPSVGEQNLDEGE